MNGLEGLRIAVVGPMPPAVGSGQAAGGMANQTRQLAELLGSEGAAITVVATNAPYRPGWIGGVPVLRAVARLVPYLAALWRAARKNELFHVMANSGWAWHLFAAPAIWIGSMRGAAVIVNYRGGEAAAFLATAAGAVRWSMRRASLLVVPSGFLKEIFAGHGMAAEVLPNVIDLARFKPAGEMAVDATETATDRTAPRAAGAGHVIVTRNLEPLYDIATALRAFAQVLQQRPHATLSVAGTGPERQRLEALATELQLGAAVRFTGALGRDEVAALYRRADVCLNASLADNSPNSLLEAFASGVPVVSTRVGGVPYLVEHERTGLLVPARDPAAMASALLRVLDDSALAARLATAGRQYVRRHTWAQVGPRLVVAYRTALSAAPAAAARA